MRKSIIILFLFMTLCSTDFFGQFNVSKHILSAQLTISPSYVFGAKEGNFHFHGSMDYYLNDKFSLSGSGYFFLGGLSESPSIFDYNNSAFFGGNFHRIRNGHDLYFGIQPGIAFTKLDVESNDLSRSEMGFNPVFSAVAGYNYFLNSYFHFFVESRFVTGNHSFDKTMSLNELKFSAGLGFHLGK